MILFKACPRCGGDVDATYAEDAHCVQCAYRPEVRYPGPRIAERRPQPEAQAETPAAAVGVGGTADGVQVPSAPTIASLSKAPPKDVPPQQSAPLALGSEQTRSAKTPLGIVPCPRCGSAELVRLDKLRLGDNTCYRCRPCGHVFSPAVAGTTSE